jgi:DNA-binding transcriptional LysR family regulator
MSTFVQIAKSGSLARAAHELGTSRSLVSAHLKQLEDHLGVLLFKRTTRNIVLTETGSEYLRSCLELLNGLAAAEGKLASVQQGTAGHLKIMASMAFGTSQLGPILMDFSKEYSDVHVSLILLDRGFDPTDFLEGDYDLGISMDHMKNSAFIRTRIADVRWVLCAGADYSRAHPRISSPADLRKHNCLVHRSHAPESVWKIRGPGDSMNLKVSGSLFTNSALVLRDAVMRGAGIAMLPLYAVQEDLDRGRLKRILPRYSGAPRPLFLVYHSSRYLPHRARLFIEFLKKEIRRRPL